MHAIVQNQLEEVLAGRTSQECLTHLAQCPECCTEVAHMRGDSVALRSLKTEVEPRAGFYARVMERIDAQRGASIWNLFFESVYGRRIAMASMALALLMGVYIVTSESSAEEALAPSAPSTQQMLTTQQASYGPGAAMAMPEQSFVIGGELPDQDSVLIQLVTFQDAGPVVQEQ